jgi:hypothetical protein
MWYALAEFVDNSTQSRLNYENLIDDVLLNEQKPLEINIIYNKVARELRIEDNSIGMPKERLIEALKIAAPTQDSKGRSRYGMGMKTASCWLGRTWRIETCEWGSGVEWTALIDVEGIARRGEKVHLTSRPVSKDAHYTRIIIADLRRNIQTRTEDTLRAYLGSMYMFDLKKDQPVPVRITYNTTPIEAPDEYEWDTDMEGKPFRKELPEGFAINGKTITGYVGVLKKGGRKFGGFSLYQNGRQIQGFPNAWKPRSIFGGVDDEGANNLVAQRLTGVIQLDPSFGVSHTKDAILFEGAEEDELEGFLVEFTKDYRQRATERRGNRPANRLSPENVKNLVENLRSEFESGEMKGALNTAQLPPLDAIIANNQQQVASLSPQDVVAVVPITQDLMIKVSQKETSLYEPYVTIATGAEPGVVHVVINLLHPYYASLETNDAIEECITQFMYDAVAEYKMRMSTTSPVQPDSVRNLKDNLMRVRMHRNESENYKVQREAVQALQKDLGLA